MWKINLNCSQKRVIKFNGWKYSCCFYFCCFLARVNWCADNFIWRSSATMGQTIIKRRQFRSDQTLLITLVAVHKWYNIERTEIHKQYFRWKRTIIKYTNSSDKCGFCLDYKSLRFWCDEFSLFPTATKTEEIEFRFVYFWELNLLNHFVFFSTRKKNNKKNRRRTHIFINEL